VRLVSSSSPRSGSREDGPLSMSGVWWSSLSTVGAELESRLARFSFGGELGDSQVPAGGVSVSSVQKFGVRVGGVGLLSEVGRRIAFPTSKFVARQSPKMVLSPAFEALRRAAEAKKGMRIARRLAGFAARRPRQRSWSSAKIPRGVC